MPEKCSIEIVFYRAALFDMDGVITDTMPLHYESWKRAFEAYGVDVDKMDVYLREGMTTWEMGRDIARAKGKSLTEEDIKELVKEKSRIFDDLVIREAKAYDGVEEMLRMLRNNGVKVALVTGSRKSSVIPLLKKIGLAGAFEVIVSGDDVEKGKPDPEPYKVAMKKLNEPALNCVVIENAPLGIRSARAAKAGFVIAVTTTLDESYLKEADDIASSIANLEQCIAMRFEARPGRAIM